MNLQVLLSVMNLDKKHLGKMNITSKCIVINQCNIENYEKYKNFEIYSYNELGAANSRNKALKHATEEILLFCDEDVIYNKNYEKIVLEEFKKNPKADLIFFNFKSPYRKLKQGTKNKRLHFYNVLRYGTYNIAIKKSKINFEFNNLFGGNSKYSQGEDTLFIVECLKNKLKLYSSTKTIGTVEHKKSSWFKGYNDKYFFNQGALLCAINKKFRYFLYIQYLLRYKETIKSIKFLKAFKLMKQGGNDYINSLLEV